MKLVLAEQAGGCAPRKGGDVLSGHLEIVDLVESCFTGYDFTVKFEGQCLFQDFMP